MAGPREFLGVEATLALRRKIFRLPDALEVDTNTLTVIERQRVYFDDILAITYHRQRGVLFLLFTGLFAGFFMLLSFIGFLGAEDPGMGIAFLILAVPFVVPFLLRLILQVDVVTVFGRRTKARMCFGFRKGRAREVYRDLEMKIRAQQDKVAAAQPPPPPAAELPPPPPEGTSP